MLNTLAISGDTRKILEIQRDIVYQTFIFGEFEWKEYDRIQVPFHKFPYALETHENTYLGLTPKNFKDYYVYGQSSK